MKDKNQQYYLIIFIYLLIGVLYFLLLKTVFNIIDVYFDFVNILLIILYLFLVLFLYLKKYQFCIIVYYITLFIFLFLRKTPSGINLEFYLFDWLKNIFTNKIIFINILGNIILFVPLGAIHKNIFKCLIIIVFIEFIQLILSKGIFDIVDIVLNTIGSLIGFLGVKLWMKIKKKSKRRK